MDYKLFDDYITLQSLLKELGIIQSGGAIKGFLAETTVLFNGEDEKRRGKKLRLGDIVSIPAQEVTITLVEPSEAEKKEHQEALAEKQRVVAIVKEMNQKVKKQTKSQQNKVTAKPKAQKPRFPGM